MSLFLADAQIRVETALKPEAIGLKKQSVYG